MREEVWRWRMRADKAEVDLREAKRLWKEEVERVKEEKDDNAKKRAEKAERETVRDEDGIEPGLFPQQPEGYHEQWHRNLQWRSSDALVVGGWRLGWWLVVGCSGLVACGWWQIARRCGFAAGGYWLVAGGWVGGWWLHTLGWWFVAVLG